MPWKIVEKRYGRDPRRDAKYHIMYQSTALHIDVICTYLEDGYKWFLNCETLGLHGIILGNSPEMSDKQVGPAAVKYISKVLAEKQDDLNLAADAFLEHLDREEKRP